MWFKKKDPICGMKQENNKGIEKHNHWFCSQNCLATYEKGVKNATKHKSGCCH